MDLPDPRVKPGSPALQGDSLPAELSGKPCIQYALGLLCRMWSRLKKKVLTASRFIPEGLVFLSPGQKIKIFGGPQLLAMDWYLQSDQQRHWLRNKVLWRIHFDIWQNQYNYVKFKNKIKLKKKEIKCSVNAVRLNHPETIHLTHRPWKNCLPWNQSLVLERLGNTDKGSNWWPCILSCLSLMEQWWSHCRDLQTREQGRRRLLSSPSLPQTSAIWVPLS